MYRRQKEPSIFWSYLRLLYRFELPQWLVKTISFCGKSDPQLKDKALCFGRLVQRQS